MGFLNARTKAGVSQEKVAAELGVTGAAVSLWENGKTQPRAALLVKIAALYLYGLLELKSGLMETEFRDSIDEFLKAVLHYLGADETKQFVQTWKRTKPQNNTETATILSTLPDTVMSDETKTKNAPFVTDWQAERAQIEKEQKQKEQDTVDNLAALQAQHEQQQGQKKPPGGQEPNGNDGGAA